MNSPRYILLAIVASTMVVAALVARFVPDALLFAGDEWRNVLVINWAYVLAAGLALGALNAYLTFAKGRVGTG